MASSSSSSSSIETPSVAPPPPPPGVPTLEQAFQYHERTKHHLHRYARSLGFLDWKTQPIPFRSFQGSPVIPLPLTEATLQEHFPYSRLYLDNPIPAQPAVVDCHSVSKLLFFSMAISAAKQSGPSAWYVRVNPSSGNLHPTECYLLLPQLLPQGPPAGVYHYAADQHKLELRAPLTADQWAKLTSGLPAGSFLLALSTIHWRESWKYGERALRYCLLDGGHAIAALTLAARVNGWTVRLLPAADADLTALLGLDHGVPSSDEEEVSEVLAVVMPCSGGSELDFPTLPAEALREVASALRAGRAPFLGQANLLSAEHHPWPVIREASQATLLPRGVTPLPPAWGVLPRLPSSQSLDSLVVQENALAVIRQRRSAVNMDGQTVGDSGQLYHFLTLLLPQHTAHPWSALPWRPLVHLILFVHRVRGLESGMYCFARDASKVSLLQAQLSHPEFLWTKPENCPEHLPLYVLVKQDFKKVSKQISCHQDIASDGMYTFGMLAEFQAALTEIGPWAYRWIFWEAGMIGQLAYLDAEAHGIAGTGIGFFFDDALHQVAGIKQDRPVPQKRAFQSVYHFTVGQRVEDTRLKDS